MSNIPYFKNFTNFNQTKIYMKAPASRVNPKTPDGAGTISTIGNKKLTERMRNLPDRMKAKITRNFFKKLNADDKASVSQQYPDLNTGDSQLVEAIVELQAKIGLPLSQQDGILGEKTLQRLKTYEQLRASQKKELESHKQTVTTTQETNPPEAAREAYEASLKEHRSTLTTLPQEADKAYIQRLIEVGQKPYELDDSDGEKLNPNYAVKLPDFLQTANNQKDGLRKLFIQRQISTINAIESSYANLKIKIPPEKLLGNNNVPSTEIHPDRILEQIDLQIDDKELESAIDLRNLRSRQILKNLKDKPTYENLLARVADLQSKTEPNPAETEQLQYLLSVVKNIEALRTALHNAKPAPATSYSPDYIENGDIKTTRDLGLPENFSNNQKIALLAVLSLTYKAHPDKLITQEILDPPTTTKDDKTTFTIKDFGQHREFIKQVIDSPIFNDTNINRANLTETIYDLQENKAFKEWLTGYLANLTPSNDRTHFLLHQIAPQQASFIKPGGWFGSDTLLEDADLRDGKKQETKQASNTLSSQSDNAIYEELLNHCRSIDPTGKEIYDDKKLWAKFEELFSIGKTAISLNDKYKSRTQELQKTPALDSTTRKLTPDQILHIKEGFKMQKDLDKRIAPPINIGEGDTAINERGGLNETRVKQALPTLLLGLTQDGKIKPGVDLGKEFYIYESDDKKLHIVASGGLTSNDFKEVADPTRLPVVKVGLTYTGDDGHSAGLAVTLGPGTIIAGPSGTLQLDDFQQWQLSADAQAGILFSLPIVAAGIRAERTIEGTLNAQLNEVIKLNNGNFVNYEKITAIANNTVNKQEMVAIADQIPEITAALGTQPALQDQQATEVKIYFLQTLCQNAIKNNVENNAIGTVGFSFGVSVAIVGGIPVVIPNVGIKLAYGTTHYHSRPIPSKELSQQQEQELIQELKNNLQSSSAHKSQEISFESGTLTLDQEGNLKVQTNPGKSNTQLELTHKQACQRLNQHMPTTGLKFQDTADNKYALEFVELNDRERLGQDLQFKVHIDPALGATAEINPETQKIKLSFGGHRAPAGLSIIRQENIKATGSGRKEVTIIITTTANPQTSRQITEHSYSAGHFLVNTQSTTQEASPHYYIPQQAEFKAYQTAARTLLDSSPYSADKLFTPTAIEKGAAITALHKGKPNAPSLSKQERNTIAALQENEKFLQEFQLASTQKPGETPATVFKRVAQLIRNQYPALNTDQIVQHFLAEMNPATYTRLDKLQTGKQRLEAINKVTEKFFRQEINTYLNNDKYNKKADGKEFIEAEKQHIIDTLVTNNLLTASESIINALDLLKQEKLNISDGTLTATFARFKNNQGTIQTGLRSFLTSSLTGQSNIKGLPVTRLDSATPSNKPVIQFIRNIFDPIDSQAPTSLANSLLVKKLATTTTNINGQEVSILAAIYGDQTAEIFNFLHNPAGNQNTAVNHFIKFVQSIHQHAYHGSLINLVTFEGNRNIGQLDFKEAAGTYFIDSCGNISLFYNFDLSARMNTDTAVTGSAARGVTSEKLASDRQVNTLGITIALPLRGKKPDNKQNPPPEGPPPEERAKANEAAVGVQAPAGQPPASF